MATNNNDYIPPSRIFWNHRMKGLSDAFYDTRHPLMRDTLRALGLQDPPQFYWWRRLDGLLSTYDINGPRIQEVIDHLDLQARDNVSRGLSRNFCSTSTHSIATIMDRLGVPQLPREFWTARMEYLARKRLQPSDPLVSETFRQLGMTEPPRAFWFARLKGLMRDLYPTNGPIVSECLGHLEEEEIPSRYWQVRFESLARNQYAINSPEVREALDPYYIDAGVSFYGHQLNGLARDLCAPDDDRVQAALRNFRSAIHQ